MAILPYDVAACNLARCGRSGECLRHLAHLRGPFTERVHLMVDPGTSTAQWVRSNHRAIERVYLMIDPGVDVSMGCEHFLADQKSIRDSRKNSH